MMEISTVEQFPVELTGTHVQTYVFYRLDDWTWNENGNNNNPKTSTAQMQAHAGHCFRLINEKECSDGDANKANAIDMSVTNILQ